MTISTEVDALQAVKDLISQRDSLRQQVDELRGELDRLRSEAVNWGRERSQLVAERDSYRRDAMALLPKDAGSFTESDLSEWQTSALPLDEFIHEIDAILQKGQVNGADR
jgi:hypothetical protein